MPGVSERIRVRSIVGRFLEHSRVWWFGNDCAPELFCSSADWLERNLLRRVEIGFPIVDPELAARVKQESLDNYLLDNLSAWELQADGIYRRIEPAPDAMPHSAQATLLAKLCG
jgi:polyphosphate kinase